MMFVKETYQNLLNEGVAPEMARMVLPQNLYTEWYWSGTLYAFSRVCNLRCAEDTQSETRTIADGIQKICAKEFPVSSLERIIYTHDGYYGYTDCLDKRMCRDGLPRDVSHIRYRVYIEERRERFR